MLHPTEKNRAKAREAIDLSTRVLSSYGYSDDFYSLGKLLSREHKVAMFLELLDRKMLKKGGCSVSLPAKYPVFEYALQNMRLVSKGYGIDNDIQIAKFTKEAADNLAINLSMGVTKWYNNAWYNSETCKNGSSISQDSPSVIDADLCGFWNEWSEGTREGICQSNRDCVVFFTLQRARESGDRSVDKLLKRAKKTRFYTKKLKKELQYELNDSNVDREIANICYYLEMMQYKGSKAEFLHVYRYTGKDGSPMITYSIYLPKNRI